MNKIVLFGDSLTQFAQGPPRAMRGGGPGWGDCLVEYYARRADVVNRGCFGYNTRDALEVDLIPRPSDDGEGEVLFATVLLGSNDACSIELERDGKHVDLVEYGRNLHELLVRARKLTSRVLVFTPPAMDLAKYTDFRLNTVKKPVDRSNDLVLPYVNVCLQVCRTSGLDCVNLYEQTVGCVDTLTGVDGLHFSESGDELMFQLVKQHVETNWPELAVHPDPNSRTYSNSASVSAIAPYLPFWDKRTPNSANGAELLNPKWKSQRPTIVLVGDSITQQSQGNPSWCANFGKSEHAGWGDMLQAVYARRMDVINRGFSGYNSRWVVDFSDLLAGFGKVELYTLFLGANDATACGEQHVPLAEYSNNMDTLISQALRHSKRVLVIGPPPMCHTKYMQWRRNRRENANKRDEEILDRTYLLALQYSNAAKALAAQHCVPFMDLFVLFGGEFSTLLSDGLHLNAQGNQRVGTAVLARVGKEWPEMECSANPDYGYYGTTCPAFPPEQPWFQDLHLANQKKQHKRVKL
ncbi:hypothetical protein BASA81_010022 [Batrachochytrium salamandrivorans]|nr:hypothetical protein BASA81_010022 [Batrachochytrium salamandrivorans]